MVRFLTSPYLLLALTALMWSSTVIIGRFLAGEVPPLALNFWRWMVALIAIAPFATRALWQSRATIVRHWRLLFMLAIFNMTAFGSLMFVGLEDTGAVNGSLMLGSMPINIVLVSLIVLRTPITTRQALGVIMGFAGLVSIVVRGDFAVLAGLAFNIGDLLFWLAILLYAFYSIYLSRAPRELDLAPFMMILFAIGSLTCLPLYLWESLVQERVVPLSFSAAWAIVYLGLFPSLIAQIFWVLSVRKVGANTAGYII